MDDLNSVLMSGEVTGISRPILFSDTHDRALDITIENRRRYISFGEEKETRMEMLVIVYDGLASRAEEKIHTGMIIRCIGALRKCNDSYTLVANVIEIDKGDGEEDVCI